MKITIHEEKNSHFTFHGEKKGPITSHENTLYHPPHFAGFQALSFVDRTVLKKIAIFVGEMNVHV